MQEPARIISLANAAIAATIGVLALIFKWQPELIAGLTVAFGAWVAFAGEVIRSKVVPVVNVALTNQDVAALEAAQPQEGP